MSVNTTQSNSYVTYFVISAAINGRTAGRSTQMYRYRQSVRNQSTELCDLTRQAATDLVIDQPAMTCAVEHVHTLCVLA